MGWIDSGDVTTIFMQGVLPLVIGIGLCFLGCLYLLGIIQKSCIRHDDQVAPVLISSGEGTTNEEGVMTTEAAQKAYGPVACEAQLYGMQQKERQAVLEKIFCECCTHQQSKEATKDPQAETQKNAEEGDAVNVDIDTRCACAICLHDYEDTDEVMKGCNCNHLFHKSCALLWLTNYKKPKDHCPYCRMEMMSAVEMKKAALEVLGEDRVQELSQFPIPNNNTTTTVGNSTSQDTTELPTVEEVPDIENDIQQER